MQYVIGIDGGGTKTVLEISDLQGDVLGKYEGGPCNLNSKGVDFVKSMLKELIQNSINDKKLFIDDCMGICIGTAGAGRETERRIIGNIIRELKFIGELIITDDAETALYAGSGKGEGIILISGTGSICYGITSTGTKHRVGGWGHLIGDEGSAYNIAVKILNIVMKSYDGREEKTILTELVLKKLNLNNAEDLIEYVYRKGNGKNEIAAIATIIGEACDRGDKTAFRIVDETVYELFNHIETVVEKLSLCDKKISLVTNGSVINKNVFIRGKLEKLLIDKYPNIRMMQMKDDAAYGAVLIILSKLKNEEMV